MFSFFGEISIPTIVSCLHLLFSVRRCILIPSSGESSRGRSALLVFTFFLFHNSFSPQGYALSDFFSTYIHFLSGYMFIYFFKTCKTVNEGK